MKNKDTTQCEGFQWDEGNAEKNWRKNKVTRIECEQLFFNHPIVVDHDAKHSDDNESRLYALGQTDDGRLLFIVFTIREELIRVISARDMNRNERRIYQNAENQS